MSRRKKDVLTVAELRRMHAWLQDWEDRHPPPKYILVNLSHEYVEWYRTERQKRVRRMWLWRRRGLR